MSELVIDCYWYMCVAATDEHQNVYVSPAFSHLVQIILVLLYSLLLDSKLAARSYNVAAQLLAVSPNNGY